jgi:hypothetical protein
MKIRVLHDAFCPLIFGNFLACKVVSFQLNKASFV